MYIIRNSPRLTSRTFCGNAYQEQCINRTDDAGRELTEWTINIDETNARPANESKKIVKSDRRPLTIVQISDTHTDPLYVEGSLADCAEPLCCRAGTLVRVILLFIFLHILFFNIYNNRENSLVPQMRPLAVGEIIETAILLGKQH